MNCNGLLFTHFFISQSQAERVGFAQPGEEKVSGRPHISLPVPERGPIDKL